jgi:hypothetical protein
MNKYILGTAVALSLIAGPASAGVISSFGTNPTSAQGFFSNDPNGGPNIGGAFSDQYTFDLLGPKFITVASATNSYPGGSATTDFITGFQAAIFEIVGAIGPGGGADILKFGPQFAAIGADSQTLSGKGLLDGGSYYLQISGNAGTTAGYGGNFATISAVPIPAALPLFGTALGGLFLLKHKRSQRRNSTSI